MRITVFALLALGAAGMAEPANAQTYGGSHPVCLHVYGPLNYYECNFTSIAQCQLSASGRAAQCDVNPYFAHAWVPPVRAGKRVRRVPS